MKRTRSTRSLASMNNNYAPSASSPPWEREDINQVPHLDRKSPALSNVELEALPSLWATRTYTVSNARPQGHTKSASTQEPINRWPVEPPLTAPAPPQPRGPHVDIPPAPKSEPNLPSFAKSPTTSPESQSSTCPTSSFGSPRPEEAVQGLPGTMSSNRDDRVKNRARSGSHRSDLPERPTRIRRWKTVMKEIFTYRPVDESQFSPVVERHWAEED